MPRQPIDYSNTSFYKIVCRDLSIADLYVGHTTDFVRRKNGHKTVCNNPLSNSHEIYLYRFIRENGGWSNFDMILIEQTACLNKLDAEKKERQYIEELNATLNQVLPSRTKKEWAEDNKERLTEYKHNWHMSNRDKLLERKKENYIEKKQEINQKNKVYYQENKEKMDEWRNTKFTCECGGSYMNHNKARHAKTAKHQDYLKSLEVED